MTLKEWVEKSPEHFFEFISYHPELHDIPEWKDWENLMDDVLKDMEYNDASECELGDLLSLSGVQGEIDKFIKNQIMNKRLNDLQSDF